MYHKRGLPKDLEQETYNALSKIYCRYLQIGAKHMSRDRIVGIMYGAMIDATQHTAGDEKSE